LLRSRLSGRPCGAGIAGSKIAGIGCRHDGDLRHGLRLKLDDPCLDLRIDAPQKRANIEIEHRAIGVDHAARFGPRRQRVECTLLERLHDFGPRSNSRSQVHL
jgi:hypothetical protein